jgi:dynein heavy chain 2
MMMLCQTITTTSGILKSLTDHCCHGRTFAPRELLSPQQHYDWGLRALKTVLRGCGSLLATNRQQQSTGVVHQAIDVAKETEIAVQALRLNTLSKLTFADAIRFDALVKDMFPGVPLKDPAYDQLKRRLMSSASHLGVVVSESQVRNSLFTQYVNEMKQGI